MLEDEDLDDVGSLDHTYGGSRSRPENEPRDGKSRVTPRCGRPSGSEPDAESVRYVHPGTGTS